MNGIWYIDSRGELHCKAIEYADSNEASFLRSRENCVKALTLSCKRLKGIKQVEADKKIPNHYSLIDAIVEQHGFESYLDMIGEARLQALD